MPEPVGKRQPPSLTIDVFTIFPGIFAGPLDESILRRARDRGIVTIAIHDIRDWAVDKHHTVDDTTYGGGAGMVLRVDVVDAALQAVYGPDTESMLGERRVAVLSASGRTFDEQLATELAGVERLTLLCGRYEGIDERVQERLATDAICQAMPL